MTQPEITARKMVMHMPISRQALEEAEEFARSLEESRARRAAMTQAERDAEDARWQAEREAAKLARTCEHCGCDPEEHGDY